MSQGAGIPIYRQKQRVLCVFDAIHRRNGSTKTIQDSQMIVVEFSDQIEEALMLAMRQRADKPIEIRLKRYLPEGGRAVF